MVFDILIKNGFVSDGSGDPWIRVDIGIEKEKIVSMGKLGGTADKVIDARGLVVCPGFIDPHNHSDFSLFTNPRGESMIRQGVTTQIIGNCGFSPAPLTEKALEYAKPLWGIPDWRSMAEYFTMINKLGTSTNIASYVGHTTVRVDVLGWEMRRPNAEEMKEMKTLVSRAMKDGAIGLSSGMYYSPGGFADTDEVVELAKVTARYGGVYHSHVRGESAMVLDAVKEAITIGEKARIPVLIAHHKAYGQNYWPLIGETLKAMDSGRNRGVEISCNVYGSTFGQTNLEAMLPYWVHEGGPVRRLERLRDPQTRERIKNDMRNGIPGWESHVKATGWDMIVIAAYPENVKYEGRNIQEIADSESRDPYDFAMDLMVKEATGSWIFILIFGQGEDDRRLVLKSRYSAIGSDGWALAPYGPLGKGKNHPRMYGCFPRILGRYVREWGVLNLEEAIRKMTSYPAIQHRIFDRGILRPGAFADIVVFDAKTINDTSTVENPYTYPTGIKNVIVNGKMTIENGEHTGALAGKILKVSSG